MAKTKDLRLHGISFEEALKRVAQPVTPAKSTKPKARKTKRTK